MFRPRRHTRPHPTPAPVLAILALAALLLATVAPTPPAHAQTDQTGVLEGRVLDSSGDPVAAAQVRGARPDGSYERTAVSSEEGRFRLGFLPPGVYVLEVSAEVGATVFNLLDEDTVTAVRTLVNDQSPSDPTTLFGAPRFRQSARTVRLDLSFRW